MPQYAFRAADNHGSLSNGAMEAAHEADLYESLSRRGLTLIDCHKKENRAGVFSNKIPLTEQVLFCRHMLALVNAGVPVHLALKDVTGISKNRTLRAALSQIHEAVLAGASFSIAFEQQGARFDALFGLLLKAGERTGKLPEALHFLHETLSWKESYSTKLKRMMVYPLVQITLASFAVLVLMTIAVPQIVQLLTSMGQELPWYSEFLLNAVTVLGAALAAAVLCGVMAGLFVPLMRVAHPGLAQAVDRLSLSLPFIGPLLTKQALARLAQLFSAMLASGVTMNEALDALPQLAHNRAMARDLERVREAVVNGQGFSAAFERGMHLPGYMIRLLKVGEDGGDLSASLTHVARLYQQESEQALEAILKGSSLAITVVVGFVLAAIVVGVLYPLYNGLGHVMGQG